MVAPEYPWYRMSIEADLIGGARAQPVSAQSRAYSTFGITFLEFLRFLHVEPEVFHPQKRDNEVAEDVKRTLHKSRSQIIEVLKGHPKRLTGDMAAALAGRCNWFLRTEIAKQTEAGTLYSFELMLTKFEFIKKRSSGWVVDPDSLAALYVRCQRGEQLTSQSIPARAKTVLIELVLDADRELLSPVELGERLSALVRNGEYRLLKESEGCTRIVIQVTPEQAENIRASFASGVRFPGLIGIREADKIRQPLDSQSSRVAGHLINANVQHAGEEFKVAWRRVVAHEELVRPWRRLRYLYTSDVRSCPLAHVIGYSRQRAYAFPGLSARLRSLSLDLRASMLLWPLLTALLLGLLLAGAREMYPLIAIGSGVATGMALAVAGSQPCSILVSPLACGGGTVLMGLVFGVAHAIVVGRFGLSTFLGTLGVRHDFFISVTGGLVGLTAPAWRMGIPLAMTVILVAGMALSIAWAAWLMGQPYRASEDGPHRGVREEIGGALVGATAGVGIAFVYLANRALSLVISQPYTLMAAFLIVGGLWIGLSTYLSVGGVLRSAISGGSHGIVGSIILGVAFWKAGTPAGLVALAAATGYFHSTWFTSAFIFGEWKGGVRAAVAAAVLEGAVGFTGFVVSRIVQG
jgi:hypothetical protein